MAPVVFALLALVAVASVPAPSPAATVDPLLLPVLSGQRGPDVLGRAAVGISSSTTEPAEPTVAVTLRLAGDVAELQGLGVTIGARLGDVVTAEVPISSLSALATHPAVRSIETSRSLQLSLNDSAPAAGITGVRSLVHQFPSVAWSGHTGRGVLIGIIDTGLDLTHRDFLRPDGSTRVLAVWDQSSSVGRPPLGFSYGAECRATDIDARDCAQVDRVGHGTHVAGIAAGNGSATGREQLAYRYIGMAPEADLLVVKLGAQTSNRVLDGLAYLRDQAAGVCRPIVVNISLGSVLGPHDGTSNFEEAINDFVTEPMACAAGAIHPGKVVVAAAGNEGADKAHTSGVVVGNVPTSVGFIVPAGATRVDLDLWYVGGAMLGLSVNTPTCGSTPSASPNGTSEVTALTACGTITIAAGKDVNNANGDRETTVVLSNSSGLTPGVWSLTLTLPSSGSATFDIWSSTEGAPPPFEFTTFASPDSEKTIAAPATAEQVIAVVHWVTKPVWESVLGIRGYENEALNALAAGASQGPRRTCSRSDACPSTSKPDLAAPGVGVMSSFSARTEPGSPDVDNRLDPDRVHIIDRGSSMAAPHVTGAVALMLQIDPELTTSEVKDLLKASAKVPPTPDPLRWGAGTLNAKAAVDAVVDEKPGAPQGLNVVAVGSGRVVLRWDPNPDLDLRGYRVSRRTAAAAAPTLLTTSPIDATTYQDSAGLINATTYLYSVTAVDIGPPDPTLLFADRESPSSSETQGTPTAGEGSVGLCFIATAAYGSAWDPHVAALRAFRDEHLLPSRWGRVFVAAYEGVSPPLARFIARHDALRAATRVGLTPVVLAVERPGAAAGLAGLGALGTIILALRRRRASS